MKTKGAMRGFTLVEIIVTLVLLGTVAVMIAPYFTNAFRGQRQTQTYLVEAADLNKVMANIVREYERRVNLAANATNSSVDLAGLRTLIGLNGTQDNTFGRYMVVNNDYYLVNATDVNGTYLRVTIRNENRANERLTHYFTDK